MISKNDKQTKKLARIHKLLIGVESNERVATNKLVSIKNETYTTSARLASMNFQIQNKHLITPICFLQVFMMVLRKMQSGFSFVLPFFI